MLYWYCYVLFNGVGYGGVLFQQIRKQIIDHSEVPIKKTEHPKYLSYPSSEQTHG